MHARALDHVPTLELLVQCQTELDRLRDQLGTLDSDEMQRRLARVELALSWIRSGNYGYCGVCGHRIADSSLRARPEQLVCDSCATPPVRHRAPAATELPGW